MRATFTHIFGLCMGLALLLVLPPPSAYGGEVRIAVAANFFIPARVIAKRYEVERKIRVTLIPSSTGKLYAQIKNGAPYDLFLAADRKRPQLLYKENLSLVPFTYAIGKVILWTGRQDLAGYGDWRKVLADPSVKRIALAQPETAPYGANAQRIIMREGLWQGIRDRLVFGQNVAQAFQYGASGSVDLAFTALSFASSTMGKKGHYWLVTGAEPVIQQGCILRERNEATAGDFVRYLMSDSTAALLKEYGYERGRS